MTSIAFVTQLVDVDDPVMGFVVRQAEALADRGARVTLIGNEVGRRPAGLDVISLGKERGYQRGRRTLLYEQAIARLARQQRPLTLLAHMSPVYLSLAAPAIKATGGRSMLWFAHPADSPTLALAERLADAILTTLPGTYPRRSAKVRVIGQAVDTARFAFTPLPGTPPVRLLALGRLAPVKGYDTILRGVAAARRGGVDATVDILGPTGDPAYRDSLLRLRDGLGLADGGHATISDGVPHDLVPACLQHATALVNATCAGSADKAVFEAMATGRPVLASNPALADLLAGTGLDLAYPPADHDALAHRIAVLATADPETTTAAAAELRSRIEGGHSLCHWADTVLALAGDLRAPLVRSA